MSFRVVCYVVIANWCLLLRAQNLDKRRFKHTEWKYMVAHHGVVSWATSKGFHGQASVDWVFMQSSSKRDETWAGHWKINRFQLSLVHQNNGYANQFHTKVSGVLSEILKKSPLSLLSPKYIFFAWPLAESCRCN